MFMKRQSITTDYTRYGLERLLRDAGFEEIAVTPNGGFWSMWFLKFNYQSTRWMRGPKPLRMLTHLLLIPIWFHESGDGKMAGPDRLQSRRDSQLHHDRP
jgi:hypothetical protein